LSVLPREQVQSCELIKYQSGWWCFSFPQKHGQPYHFCDDLGLSLQLQQRPLPDVA
jgi:hypothetical protein